MTGGRMNAPNRSDAREFLESRVTWWQAIVMFLALLGAMFLIEDTADEKITTTTSGYEAQLEAEIEAIANEQSDKLTKAVIDMCERNKLDRIDNARAWTEIERYMELVSEAATAEAIRDQASDTRVKVGESANQLRTRLYLCEPLIRQDLGIIDDRALREAKGDL